MRSPRQAARWVAGRLHRAGRGWRALADEARQRGVGGLARALRRSLRQVGVGATLARLGSYAGQEEEERIRYARWLKVHTPTIEDLARMREEANRFAFRPLVSVITPVYNTDPAFLAACIESVRRQAYPNWELCLADDASSSPATLGVLDGCRGDPRIKLRTLERNRHISAASNVALGLAEGEYIALLDHDDELAPEALFEVVKALNEHPATDFVYTDEDKLDIGGQRCEPCFKPDWSPEMFRSFMYTNHLMVLRRAVVERAGGFRVGFEGSQDYDLALRVIESTDRVVHVPNVLYHWRKVPGSAAAELEAKPWALMAAERALREHLERQRLHASVSPGFAPGVFRVRFALEAPDVVTLVVVTADRTLVADGRQTRLLTNCLRSVVERTAAANYEILVVDDGHLSDESEAFLQKVPHRRVSCSASAGASLARKLNFAARHATGAHLLFLDESVEVINAEWLSAMQEYSQQEAIGAVGAKLLFPDGRIQHIGVVLGVCGLAAHAFHGAPGWSPGYAGSARVVRNYSCVTGACLMTRRAVFEEIGGFDERLPDDYGSLDYCLRLRRGGYRIVFTPYAQLYHLEPERAHVAGQPRAEAEQMRAAWGAAIESDPYYNPNLTRDFPDHRIGD